MKNLAILVCAFFLIAAIPVPEATPTPTPCVPPTKRCRGMWPPVTSERKPDDYVSETERGTIEHATRWSNYSFHTVEIGQPDGGGQLVIESANFTQDGPDTVVFVNPAGEEIVSAPWLTIRDSNLWNVRIPKDVTLINCNAQDDNTVPAPDEEPPE